ncbi:HK97 family phage prohead protease [Streptomyces rubiginosohelvolus]|uniref:HK97 family phage prohead protease n=1 Tax=Streptomyces rubiginosohelvolus TaxID=67362 RepID=UPI0033B9F07D
MSDRSLFGDRFTVRCAVAVEDAAQAEDAAPGPRTMGAVLAEYGKTVQPMSYFPNVRLASGALALPEDLNDVKLLRDHDRARVVGAMTEARGMDAAPFGRFRFARTADADDAYSLVEDRIITHVSVGYRIIDGRQVVEDEENVFEVTAAEIFEVSLLGQPADTAARIESVTAQKGPAVNAPAPAPAAVPDPTPEVPPATLTDAQLTAVMDQVRAQLAPAQAAPVAAPAHLGDSPAPRLLDRDGNPIVVRAADRFDPRVPAATGRDGRRITPGDYFAAYAAGVNEGDWTRHNEIRAALADELTSDVPGLLPAPIVGELLGRASGRRPLWSSLTPRDMPMQGEKFSRPRITQHVQVAPQTGQKKEVASRKYTAVLDEVGKTTLAGALDVAQQAIDWTSPSLLNELIIDFTRIYIARTDAAAAAALVAAATAGAVTVEWDGTTETLTGVLAQAAGLVYAGADPEMDVFPNSVWLSVDMWVKLASLVDGDGRPLLPSLGPTNAPGTINLGNPESGVGGSPFRWIVSKHLAAGTMIMGDSTYAESYENGRRFLQAVRPDVLGLDIAYMGYTATYFPYPKTLVRITAAAPTPPPEGAAARSGGKS